MSLWISWRQIRPACTLLFLLMPGLALAAVPAANAASLYRWVDKPGEEAIRLSEAEQRLAMAIANPEYMLHHWVELPFAPDAKHKKPSI